MLELDLALARAAGLDQKAAEIAAELSKARKRRNRYRRQNGNGKKYEVNHAR